MSYSRNRWLAGAVAGLAATLPMTLFMVAAHRFLPRRQRGELPPARITGAALRKAGISGPAEGTSAGVVLANHFAYGAAIGAIYRGMLDPLARPTPAKGVAFGLGVWTGSYLGWLPWAGLHPSASEEPREQQALMILAHIVWGAGYSAALALVEQRLPAARTETGESDMAHDSDRFTIIHRSTDGPSETVATGLTREQARLWLERKAGQTGRKVSRDLTIETPDAPDGEHWQAVKAE